MTLGLKGNNDLDNKEKIYELGFYPQIQSTLCAIYGSQFKFVTGR